MNASPGSQNTATHPDLRVLRTLGVLQSASLYVIAAIAGTVLCAWLIPPIGRLLPSVWSMMKADTATSTLLCGASILFNQTRRSPRSCLTGRLIGLCVVLYSAITLGEYLYGVSAHMGAFLIDDTHSPFPGRMSVHSAVSFLLLGIVLSSLRETRRPLADIVDSVTLALSLLILVFTAGVAFRAMGLFGTPMQHHLSNQTLLCLILLTFLVFNCRTEYGVFSIMIDNGIGGKTARFAAPFALLLPFTVAAIRGLLTRYQVLPEQYGVALASAFMALVAFCFVGILSWRCNRLEKATLEISLRDQLTHVYNRRGFYLLAEQSLKLSSRARTSFFLLFFDLDGLKQTNDDLGHEAGSARLREMASILQNTFRESDVIGRIGGDEFVVAGNGNTDHVLSAAKRLQNAAIANSFVAATGHPLSFSLGYAVATEGNSESLDELIQRADSMMYEAKRARKSSRLESSETQSTHNHSTTAPKRHPDMDGPPNITIHESPRR
jgi:diguanylate cyclase (GGDEF)-like protein